MINRQFEIQGVTKQDIESLETVLEAHLENTHYFKESGLQSDAGSPEYPFANVKLTYGIKHVILHPTPAVWVEAHGQ